MSELLFVRHAETDMAGTFCGHSDPELNTRGFAQLPALIHQLRVQNIGAVYSSDLRRAHATAAAIANALQLPCHTRPGLREIHFGEWEGLRWSEIEARDPAFASNWLTEYPHQPAPGGETLQSFETRVLRSVDLLCKAESPRNIAVVTHAGVIRTILCRLQGYSSDAAWQKTRPYCCIVPYTNPASAATVNLRAYS